MNTDLMGLRIKQKRTEKNITQDDLAKNLGLNKSTIQRYETGKIKAVKLPVIEAMARMLHVNPAWLIGKSEEETPSYSVHLDSKSQELLNNYNKLNDLGQHEVRKRASELTEIPRYLKDEPESKIITLDMDSFEMPASAGTGMFLSDEYKEVIQVKDCYEARTADFVIPIAGDSMEPLYSDGDRVFVKSMPMVEVGEIGIFVINGDAYIKKRGRDRLISLNRKRKDIVFREGDTIVCLGKVIGKVEE
ncbi:MAG: helix-turn-helix transcriptional regulator [Clostridiales bacterium]|nr:helix-turn-helix transcriptional regulator [Clostridiales bacterium]